MSGIKMLGMVLIAAGILGFGIPRLQLHERDPDGPDRPDRAVGGRNADGQSGLDPCGHPHGWRVPVDAAQTEAVPVSWFDRPSLARAHGGER